MSDNVRSPALAPNSERHPFDATRYEFRERLVDCTALDLFCGAGGLTYGLTAAGIGVAAGIDVDENCRFPFEANNDSKFILRDVALMSVDELKPMFPEGDLKVMVGCAPCQDFSRYSRAKRAADSERWALLNEFGRLVRELEPEIVSMENVPEIQLHTVYGGFMSLLNDLDYHVSVSRVYCPAYGVPQTRERVVLLASKLAPIALVPPLFAAPKDHPRLSDTISAMEPLEAGAASDHDALHRCSKLSATNMKRIEHSIQGGTWRDWPEELRCKCHRQETGKTYCGVYGRMEWEKPAPTLTTQFFGYGNGRFGHPEQNRAISLREGALIQSFPPNYRFVAPDAPVCFSTIGRLVGNAVPPRLGVAVGDSIRRHVEDWRGNHA